MGAFLLRKLFRISVGGIIHDGAFGRVFHAMDLRTISPIIYKYIDVGDPGKTFEAFREIQMMGKVRHLGLGSSISRNSLEHFQSDSWVVIALDWPFLCSKKSMRCFSGTILWENLSQNT